METDLVSKFRHMCKLYRMLGEHLSEALNPADGTDAKVLVESVLRNRGCFAQIEQMNLQVLGLVDEWKKCRTHLQAKSRNEIQVLTAAAGEQAARLREICRIHTRTLDTACEGLQKESEEIRTGKQYLDSVKPVKGNYPKFVDSLG